MKHTYTIIFLIASTATSLFAQLPKEADELVSKLSNWELDRQAELQKEIQAKRGEVVRLLERVLVETTKSGNLEGALAIKNEIERLSQTKLTQPEAAPPTVEEQVRLKDYLIGSSWIASGSKIIFIDRKTARFVGSENKEREISYEIVDEGAFNIFWSSTPNKCVLSEDRQSFTEAERTKWSLTKQAANKTE